MQHSKVLSNYVANGIGSLSGHAAEKTEQQLCRITSLCNVERARDEATSQTMAVLCCALAMWIEFFNGPLVAGNTAGGSLVS